MNYHNKCWGNSIMWCGKVMCNVGGNGCDIF
jgi:hypothetical protein